MLLGIILAGGQSTRMGEDKGALCLNGETLLTQVAHALTAVGCDHTLISRNQSEYINDIVPHCGPLSGIHSTLFTHNTQKLHCSEALILPIDMPLLTDVALRHLVEQGRILQKGVYYHSSYLPFYIPIDENTFYTCDKALEDKRFRMKDLLAELNAMAIFCPFIENAVLYNMNTPDEWRFVQQYIASK